MSFIEEAPHTPTPIKARINNLQAQVTDLCRDKNTAARRHNAETAQLQSTLDQRSISLKETSSTLEITQGQLKSAQSLLSNQKKAFEDELARCKAEGEAMRQELNLHSVIQQQKAILALAQEQMQMIELEHRLVQAETARVMRDHKILLFQAKEEDLVAELSIRDARLERLEASLSSANTSIAHQKAQSTVHAQNETTQLKSTIARLEANDEKHQAALKKAKSELQRKVDELEELQEELVTAKEEAKEREKAIKAKYRARLEESEEPKTKKTRVEPDSPPPKPKAKAVPKPSPKPSPKAKSPKKPVEKKPKPVEKPVEKPKPLEVADDNVSEIPEKKKRRKLFATQTNFTWDPIMNSGDGVIPSYLSPVKSTGIGGIPRAGFPSLSSRRF